MPELKPRRPAMLAPNQTQMIIGANRVDEQVELAHFLADLLLGLVSESEKTFITDNLQLRDDAIDNLMEILQQGDIEVVAEIWADSPADSIPGLMWRLYLVYQWYLRDSLMVEWRYQEGLKLLKEAVRNSLSPSMKPLIERMSTLWRGSDCDFLATTLEQTAAALKIMAAGVSAERITDSRDILADKVTIPPVAIWSTAKELEAGLQLLKKGKLR